jgi:adenylate cyclase
VLEDLHWADASSLALVIDLARRIERSQLALVLVARPEARAALAELPPDHLLAMELEPLDTEGVEAIVAAMLDSEPPPGVGAFVARRSAGNPFFVQELVRALQDARTLVADDGRWVMRPGWDERRLPPTIEEVLSARIDLLPRAAVDLLQTAAVIGRQVRLSLLRAVAGADAVDASLDRVYESGMLQPGVEQDEGAVVFPHALVQDAAYDRLLRRRQRDLHRRVAEVAESLYGAGDDTIDLLARHLYLGQAGPKASEYLKRAAERAKGLYANDEAILHLSRAAELSPEPSILLDLADLHELVGNLDEALRIYRQVRDEARDLKAWCGIASTLRKRGEYEQALATVEAAFRDPALAGLDLTPLWLEQAWTLTLAGRLTEAIDVGTAGVAAAHTRRIPVVGHLLLQLCHAESVVGNIDNALAHALEAHELFEFLEDVRGLAVASRVLGGTLRLAGRLDDAAESLRRGVELAERVGSVEELGGCLINLGMVELERGQIQEALAATARATEEFERVGIGSGRAQGHANLAWIYTQNGDYEQALAEAERALEVGREINHPLIVGDTLDTVATVELREGRFADAARHAEEAVALFLEVGAAPRAVTTLATAAEAWEKAGEAERARATREQARSLTPA